jgi:hypothetical protein
VEKQNMPDALGDTADNVIPVWGLMPDEWLKICAQAQKLIRQGRATDISEERRGTYICVHDRHRAPYTVGREQRVLHLLGPGGETIALSKNLEVIINALASRLQRYN